MPSAGRPKANARVDPIVIDAIELQLELTALHANYHTILDDEISTFVERAILEKLAKMRRSRDGRKKRKAGAVSTQPASSERSDCQCTLAPEPVQVRLNRLLDRIFQRDEDGNLENAEATS